MGAIDRLGRDYRVHRFKPGARVDGYWKPGAELTAFTIQASIQPLSGAQLSMLPEGERNKEYVRIYTETELFGNEEKTGTKGDRVEYRGRQYEVQGVAPWTDEMPEPHFKLIASRVEDN